MIHADKATLLLALLLIPARLYAAPPEFQIDIKELDRQKPPAASKPAQKPAAKQQKQAPKKKEPAAKAQHEAKKEHAAPGGEQIRYTIKPGDHIFKILVGHFGMSNEAAERLVPEIIELNDIKNIKTLEVGRTLLIPAAALHGHEAKPARKEKGGAPEVPAAKPKGAQAAKETAKETAKEAKEAKEAKPVPPPRAPEPAAEAPRAPEPAVPVAPAPTPVPKAAPPVPVQKSAPAIRGEVLPEPVPKPAPAAPAKTAPSVAAPVAPSIPQAATWICPVGRQEAAAVVDSVLNALSAVSSRNKIIHSAAGAATPFSIRVDRYFEYKGNRYIVSIGESDPYNYTLIRILETAGYRVLMLTGKEDFQTVTERLFRLVGVAPDFGPHALQEGKQATGFLVQQDDAGGRRVLITNTAPPPGHKWVLPAGCGAR
ncbi:LysM peptidoglycan-binding domain-containing protein [Geomonas azotofigens]|uniref:LysM peptidoglycan-binding domain-containing protein n=1 Tax=Geomonas azotofigens TaxID=2843196 RepID=UPI001C0F6C18|nr:LysM peptidoglycan-binding domain-containing protein [Geomonas azotofigens]MBU5612007.1 LysM peptidoglycan-binding domain-containing protein [Geomonas azotofigens]